MNIKVISRNVGSALLVSALFMFLSILVSMANGNDSALAALSISFVLTFIVGIFPFIFVTRTSKISLKDGYMIVVLSWLLSFVFGMLPYALWGGPFSVVNAWFESVSGFTTTGATILANVENLPDSLLFWRSSTHFIGGLGVVVFLLLLIPNNSAIRFRLTNMEISSLSRNGYRVRQNKTVFIFAYVYIGICIAAFICYVLAGMTPFDAINHAMSVCATGGFSTKNESIGSFNSTTINFITIFFMYLASVHFGLIFLAVIHRSIKPLNNPVLKYYTYSIIIATVIVALRLRFSRISFSWGEAFMDGAFHVVSYASTTGFAVADNANWPLFVNVILMFMGVQCGMAGSTTGGLKADRVYVLFKAIGRQVKSAFRPAAVSEIKIGNTYLRDESIYPHILYAAMFGLFLIFSLIVCLALGVDTGNALAGTASCLGNVGPALKEIGTFGNYGMESSWVKFVFTIDMFLGRVEIYPVLAVFAMLFGDRRK
ncbi:MAG: TrkH family potassium uptake protein [Bacteroidales bacterium]|nr:TrkH family potassium uptake protein [Bacteroidales bacterium]